MSPAVLNRILSKLPRQEDPRLIVGFGTRDDAGVYLAGGLKKNREFVGACVVISAGVPTDLQHLIFDPRHPEDCSSPSIRRRPTTPVPGSARWGARPCGSARWCPEGPR